MRALLLLLDYLFGCAIAARAAGDAGLHRGGLGCLAQRFAGSSPGSFHSRIHPVSRKPIHHVFVLSAAKMSLWIGMRRRE